VEYAVLLAVVGKANVLDHCSVCSLIDQLLVIVSSSTTAAMGLVDLDPEFQYHKIVNHFLANTEFSKLSAYV